MHDIISEALTAENQIKLLAKLLRGPAYKYIVNEPWIQHLMADNATAISQLAELHKDSE
jgi:hypothetical protein